MHRVLGIAVLLVLVLGCGYDIEDGTYEFQQVELLRSSCTLDPPIPSSWKGEVTVRGPSVEISLQDPAFHAQSTQQTLVGHFQPDHRRDVFLVDSTSDIEVNADGLLCLVFSHIQIAAEIHGGDRFDGNLFVSYSRQLLADPECPFACITEMSFKARRK